MGVQCGWTSLVVVVVVVVVGHCGRMALCCFHKFFLLWPCVVSWPLLCWVRKKLQLKVTDTCVLCR